MALNIRNKQGNDAGITTQPANDSIDDSISSEINETTEVTTATFNNVNKNVKNPYLATRPRVTYTVRTVNKAALMAQLGNKVKSIVPPLISFSPPIEDTARRLMNDSVNTANLTVNNGQVRQINSYGISSRDLRPEIVAMVDFSPIWKPSTNGNSNVNLLVAKRYSDNGLFLKFQYQTKLLRQDTFINTLKNIRRITNQNGIYNPVRNDYLNEVNLVQTNLNYIKNVYDNINTIKKSFEIRAITEQNYRIVRGNDSVNIPTLKQYFTENLGYPERQYNDFSETLIFLQILYELQLSLQNISREFLDFDGILATSRFASVFTSGLNLSFTPEMTATIAEDSPIKVNKKNTSSFTLQNVSSNGTIINAGDDSFFTSFLAKLPSDPDNRIRLLTYLLAKEYSVSKGLGNSENKKLFETFGISDIGNPFPTIIGDINDNILYPPTDQTSLASLAYGKVPIPGNENVNILTFENKYIDDPNNSSNVWIPGNTYYTDQIINLTGNTWNTTEYSNYVSQYNNTVRNAIVNVNKLLGIDAGLTGLDLNTSILEAFYTSFDKLSQQEENVANAIAEDPAKYQQKLSLEAQKRDLTAQLELINSSRPFLNLEAEADDGGDIGEQARDFIENFGKTDSTVADAIKAKISEINQKLADLGMPALPESLVLTTEQALIMSMFSYANENNLFKRILFYFCITAGMIRNKPGNQNDIFVLLSKNDINEYGKLYGFDIWYPSGEFKAVESLPSNGEELISYLRFLADKLSEIYSNSFLPNSSAGGVGVDSSSDLLVYLSSADIVDILMKAALGQGSIGNINLVYQFINVANRFFKKAQLNGTNVHLLSDNSGRTRFNQISISTQLLMLFEIFTQYSRKYSFIQRKFSDQISILGQINITRSEINDEGQILESGRGGFGAGRNRDGIGGNESVEYVRVFGTSAQETESQVLNVIALKINAGKTSLLQKAITLLTSNPKEDDAKREREINEVFASLENNKKKIEREYSNIQNGLAIYQIIGQNFSNTLSQILQFFTQEGLKEFLKTGTIRNLDLIKNVSQLRISSQLFDDIKKRTAVPAQYVPPPAGETSQGTDATDVQMIVSDTYIPAEYSILEKFLSTGVFVPGPNTTEDIISRNMKILTVGIPTGFNKNLIDKVSVGDINIKNFKDRQADIITVNVYVRNGKYPQIVLKPVKYIFDISLFATKENMLKSDPQVGEGYLQILNRMSIYDFEDAFSPVEIGLQNIKEDPKYNILNDIQKNFLFVNHVNSYLLGCYVSLMTGTRISEDIFLNPEPSDRVLNPKARVIADTYLKALGLPVPPNTTSISNVLANNDINDDVKDLYRLFTYGSLVFNQGEVSSRVLTPKTFDRLLYIPINTYVMEVDIEETLKMMSREDFARTVASQGNKSNFIVQVDGQRNQKIFLKDSGSDEFVLKDIFVEIETVLNTETKNKVRTYTQAARGIQPNMKPLTNQTNNRQGTFNTRPFKPGRFRG